MKKKLKEIWSGVSRIATTVKNFVVDTVGMFKSLITLYFKGIKLPATFYGHYNYSLAKKYAYKRFSQWKDEWDQLGRQQAVIPFNQTSLLVCSKLEMKYHQKIGILSKDKNYKKYFKTLSYYKTDKNVKK